VPLMVTGGFRTRAGMEHALQAGVAVVGLARPMVQMMDAPKQILGGLEVGSFLLSHFSAAFGRERVSPLCSVASAHRFLGVTVSRGEFLFTFDWILGPCGREAEMDAGLQNLFVMFQNCLYAHSDWSISGTACAGSAQARGGGGALPLVALFPQDDPIPRKSQQVML
jgi:hypothetical protein